MAAPSAPNRFPALPPWLPWAIAGLLALFALAAGFRAHNQKQRAEEAIAAATQERDRAGKALEAAVKNAKLAEVRVNNAAAQAREMESAGEFAARELEKTQASEAAARESTRRLEQELKSALAEKERLRAQQVAGDSAQRDFASRLRFELAVESFAADNAARGIALLAGIVRDDPGDTVAATRLISALSHRSFALPLAAPIPVAPNSEVLAFRPDGNRVATLAAEPPGGVAVEIRNLAAGENALVTALHSNRIEHLEFSPDGTRLLLCENRVKKIEESGRTALLPQDGSAWIRDAATGSVIAGPLAHDIGVWSASFNPDGNRVLTVGGDRTARIWNATTGQPIARPLPHPAPIERAFFSPDGSQVATLSGSRIHLWDAHTGDGPAVSLDHNGAILDAQFTIDGKLLVVYPADDKAVVWDPRSGQRRLSAPFPLPNIAPAAGARISPDGQRIAAAHTSEGAAIWDAFSGQYVTERPRHTLPVTRVGFSPNGRVLATTAADGTARLWDALGGFPLSELIPNLAWPRRFRFSPRGDRLALLQGTAGVEIRTALPGAARPLSLFANNPLISADYSADGATIVAADEKNGRHAWNSRSGRRAGLPPASEAPAGFLARVASGTTVIIEGGPGKPRVLSLDPSSVEGLRSVTVSKDGGKLIAVMDGRETDVKGSLAGGSAHVFDVDTGKPLTERLVHSNPIASARFSDNGRRIATASLDRQARVFDISGKTRELPPLRHSIPVVNVLFSPDGSRLLTHTLANDLRVWNVATGRPVSETKRQWGRVVALRFNPAGDQVLILTETGSIELWDVPIAPSPAPAWLPDLAEAVAGRTANGADPDRPAADRLGLILELRQSLATANDADFYNRWGKWFLADRNSRAISPFCELGIDQFLRSLLDENSFESVLEAVAIAPDNARALARLALLTLDEPAEENIRRIGEADFYSLRALQLDPQDTEVIRVREIVTAALKEMNKPAAGN